MDNFNEEVGKRIYKARTEKGITLKELGDLIGIAESTAQRYEKGKIKTLDIEMIKKLATALGVSPAHLMGWKNINLSEKTISIIKAIDDLIENKKPTKEETAVSANIFLKNNPIELKDIPKKHHNNIISMTDLFKKVEELGPEERMKLRSFIDNLEKSEETTTHLTLNAAHEIEGASEEDRQHDEDIMNDDNF